MIGAWKKVKIGDFLKLYRNEHIVQDEINYRQITISKNHGISLRGGKLGKNIGRKRQFTIDLKSHPNTVLFTRQGVLDGAIGIAPEEVDECIVTENMPMMSVDTNIIKILYLKKLLLSDYLYDKIRLLTVVGSAQKSIHERDFLKIGIQLPSIKIQQETCNKFNALDSEHKELNTELTHQQTLLKKLRQQILQEAIEGKLTKQWRIENGKLKIEPASELLKRIQAEKEQLIKDKKIKKQKPLPPISEKEKPFNLPEGWVWCRLGEVVYSLQYGTSKKCTYDTSKNTPILRIPNVSLGTVDSNDLKFTDLTKKEKEQYSLKSGDLLVIRSNGSRELVGKSVAVSDQFNGFGYAGYLIRLRFKDDKLSSNYINKYFGSLYLRDQIETPLRTTVGINNINSTELSNLLFPLPSLPEQKVIITKVEKLLAVCDELEERITENQIHAQQLMQSVLKEAFSQSEKAEVS